MSHIHRPPHDVVKDLMGKVNDKVPGAEEKLLNLISPWLLDLIRQKLDQRLRRIEDSWDILQEALMVVANSCARRHECTPEKFFLTMEKVIVRRTVSANRRHLDCQKRQDARFVDFSAEFSEEHQPFSSNPEPFQEAEARETWQILVDRAPEPVQRFCA